VKYNSGESAWRVVERYSYAPYGVATFRDASWTAYAGPNPQSLFSNTTLYTGRTWDALISLYYYRARFYDAVLERFIGRDPIGYGADINLYRYCGNNPVIYVDPKGLERTPPPACKCCCALDLKINQLKDISKTGLSGRADIHALVSFIIKLTWVDAPKSAGGADCRLEWYEYTTHEDVTRKGYETGKWNNAIDYATKHPGTILDPWIRGDRTYGSPEEFPPFNDKPGVQGATGQATGTVYIAIRLRSAKGCVCDNPDPKPLLIQVDIDAQGDPPTKPKLLGTMPNPPGDPPFEP
jgi:RHS repeat-associated protein